MNKICTPPPALFIILFSMLSLKTFSETLVNRTSVDTLGHAISYYNLFTGTNAEDGHVILAGNGYLTSAYEAFFIAKYSLDTGIVWMADLTPQPAGKRQFGTDVYFKKGFVYGAAFTWDSASGKAAINAIKIDNATGDTVWTTNYTGSYNGYNVPSSIVVDSSGNVFIAGTEQTGALDFKMIVIKYNSSGTQQWVADYDSVGLYDGAVAAELTNTRVNLTGFSGNGFGSWDFVQGSYLKTNGSVQQIRRHGNGAGDFSHPIGLGKDLWSNLYVGGTAAFGNGKTGIKILSYDTSFTLIYAKRMGDTTQNCEAVAMETDIFGNVTIVGTQSKSNGGKDIITAKYDTSGTQLWLRTISAPDPTKEAKAGDIAMQDLSGGNLYITGSMSNGTNTDVVTFSYDTDGNLRWLKTFTREGNYNDAGTLVLNDENYVQVALTSYGSDSLLMGITYEELNLPVSYVLDTSNTPTYRRNQLIVRIDPLLVNPDFVDNREVQFGFLEDVLVDSIIDSISVKTGFDFNDRNVQVGKIFKQLVTSDTLNITKQGDTIPFPKFWSTLLFSFSPLEDSILNKIEDSLNNYKKFVFYAEKSVALHPHTYPNDPGFPALNTNFYGKAYLSLCDATQSINICPLWLEGLFGDPNFKIGIFDSGIRHTHEEFALTLPNSKAYEGRDFLTGLLNPNDDVVNAGTGHGTCVASIAAGLSNNSLGSTGVAGGDINGLGSNPGCTLVNMRTQYDFNATCDALIMGAYNTPATVGGGYDLNVANMSWGFPYGQALPNTAGYNTLKACMRWLYKNGVTSVASSGNTFGYVNNLPASLDDNFVIKVAGSDINGEFNTSFSSGLNVDVLAPSEGIQFVTASALSDNSYLSSPSDKGTSLSAPLVSGAIAILQGYYFNETFGSPDQTLLLPDDIENLLEIYAKNDQVNPNYGHGLVDISNTYDYIRYPQYKIRQFRCEPADPNTVSLEQSAASIKLLTDFENSYATPPVFLEHGNYVADVYKVSGTVNFNLPGNETLLNSWENNSITNLWAEPTLSPGTGVQNVYPESDFSITSISAVSADIEGYAYHFISGPNGSMDIWAPVDVSGTNYANALLGLSLHTYDPTYTELTKIKRDDASVSIFPNPTNNELTVVVLSTDYSIQIHDIQGKEAFNTSIEDSVNQPYKISTEKLNAGVYIITVTTKEFQKRLKFIVQH